MRFCTFQLHSNSSNLDLLKTCINSLIKYQIAMAYKGSFVELPWNLLGLIERHVYNLGYHPVITIKNVTYIIPFG